MDLTGTTALVTGATSGIGRCVFRFFFSPVLVYISNRTFSADLENVQPTTKLHGDCRETAFALAKLGATIILGCRNVDAARQISQEIR